MVSPFIIPLTVSNFHIRVSGERALEQLNYSLIKGHPWYDWFRSCPRGAAPYVVMSLQPHHVVAARSSSPQDGSG